MNIQETSRETLVLIRTRRYRISFADAARISSLSKLPAWIFVHIHSLAAKSEAESYIALG